MRLLINNSTKSTFPSSNIWYNTVSVENSKAVEDTPRVDVINTFLSVVSVYSSMK